MTPEDWKRVKPILDSALRLDSSSRTAYLKQSCGDPALRREIESLIAAHEQAGSDALNSSPVLRSTLASGTRLGDFQIVSFLGAGGMGDVYRAKDLRLERDVAIKVLPSFVSVDPERLRRFEQEAKAAAALNHPNILAVFQMGSYEGAPYLVSELLEGETLREQVKRGPVPPKKSVDYAVQIARGLAAAHEKGIVHRDLKPENLFVTRDGRIKILDFGLAKLLHTDGETQLTKQTLDTQPGAVMGTAGYMAPEQVRGLAADHRADIFAFGAILYEMLTGKRAFSKSTSADTMSAILNEDPPPISQATPSVPPALERAVQRCLEKNPEQRFQSASDLAFALELSPDSGPSSARTTASAKPRTAWKWITAAAVALALLSGILLWRPWQPRRLNAKDTIVLADFTNTTGDSVFDDALKQALSVGLRQSPFFKILSDQKIQDTLKLMNRPADQRLTPEVAREICQRTGSKALLVGSISSLGSEYVVGLNAIHCASGNKLVQDQAEAQRKEEVLKTLDQLTRNLRATLGESLSSVQKYDTPLTEATTSSLEALKAFSLAEKAQNEKGDVAAIPYYKRAIELDPQFAAAYAQLGNVYVANLTEPGEAAEYVQKAYELRERVSEHEKTIITINYHAYVTGELEKTAEESEQGAQAFPESTSFDFLNSAGLMYEYLGEYEKAVSFEREAIRADPENADNYSNLMEDYIALGRVEEAKATYLQAVERNRENGFLHGDMYIIAFLLGDSAEMRHQVELTYGKPGEEDFLLSTEADFSGFNGLNQKAREFARQAVVSATRSDLKETAALWRLNSALREAEFGNRRQAREEVREGLALAGTRDAKTMAALTLARTGDFAGAQKLIDELAKLFPLNTAINGYWLPCARGYLEFQQGKPAQALKSLQAASRYEYGMPPPQFGPNALLYPIYVRGQAYLQLHQAKEAAAEFQKMLDHRSMVAYSPLASLVRVQIARAYAMQGDTAKAKVAYQDFLTLWKDADPDIPILKEAKTEYAKLL
ncbi:MAG TPA: protein kinase [Candidatus Acidoferrum sp.]|nr:protein kinase [Candidatus Acidoferrum sp.]